MTTIIKTIPKGYKQTEIGVIPADWDLKHFSAISSMKSGLTITSESIDTYSQYPCYGGNGLRGYTKSYTHDGTYALIGRQGALCGNVISVNGKFFASEHAIVVSPLKDTDINWFSYVLKRMNLNQYSESSAQPGLSVAKILSLRAAFPKGKIEQTAIATALSDADNLIEKIETLIEKKKKIKQGAMQELLTDKRRLPGFSGAWERKSLGDFLDYEQPTKYLVKSTDYNDSHDIPVLTAGKTFVLGYTDEEFGLFQNLPTIIFDDFTTAIKYVDFPFKAKSSAMKMLIPKIKDMNLKFIFSKMHMLDFKLLDHKRYWISEYQKLEIDVPKPDEQTAIANVLSEMDTEIERLESELTKYRNIKQGMMQTLLTGKIRLIK